MSRLLTLTRSLQRQPAYTLMRGVGRFETVRGVVASSWGSIQSDARRRVLAESDEHMAQSSFQGLDAAEFAARIERDGLAFGLQLSPAIVQEIHAYAAQAVLYADRNPAHGFHLAQLQAAEERLGKPLLLAQYLNTEIECEAIRRLATDPFLRAVACHYLQAPPKLVGTNLWWTFPVQALESDRREHAHLFHRDVDDFRFFKFFFYLTDVEPGEGAHVCVRGSHRRPPEIRSGDRWNIRRYSDEEVGGFYAAQDIREITGPSGTGFAENTLCVHKGMTPRTKPRLLLQLQFALFDYGVMHDRREPGALGRLA